MKTRLKRYKIHEEMKGKKKQESKLGKNKSEIEK